MLFAKFRMVDKAKQLFLGRDSQFVVDVARMGAHRGLRDVKALGNVGVAVAARSASSSVSRGVRPMSAAASLLQRD